jgi:hypothetical protein
MNPHVMPTFLPLDATAVVASHTTSSFTQGYPLNPTQICTRINPD